MTTMRAIALTAALCGTLALGACQTTALDNAIRTSLPQTCRAADAAYQAFMVYASAGAVSPVMVDRVEIAWLTLGPICSDPASQNTATVLVAAAQAYATITIALDEASE